MLRFLLRPFRNAIVRGLKNIEARNYYCHGPERRLHLGAEVSLVNTVFNVASGDIYIGDHTIFGHNCLVLTGRHEFTDGKRRKLSVGGPDTPAEGFDIRIGMGCWIASGVVITGGVTIGDHSMIGAGSVVTRDIPSGVFAAGVPARVIKTL